MSLWRGWRLGPDLLPGQAVRLRKRRWVGEPKPPDLSHVARDDLRCRRPRGGDRVGGGVAATEGRGSERACAAAPVRRQSERRNLSTRMRQWLRVFTVAGGLRRRAAPAPVP